MAGWITHTIIADDLLRRLPALDARGFCIGSIAPDCNIENADWTAFTPPREVTHFMRGKSKLTADCEGFWAEYVEGRRFASAEEYAFFCGYYAHLITDVEYQRFGRDEARVSAMLARVKAEPTLAAQIAGMPETFDTCKAMFSRKRLCADIARYESRYLRDNPDASYLTILRPTEAFPDYLDFLPPGAIARKIGIMATLPEADGADGDGVFFTEAEYRRYLAQTSERIFMLLDRRIGRHFSAAVRESEKIYQ